MFVLILTTAALCVPDLLPHALQSWPDLLAGFARELRVERVVK